MFKKFVITYDHRVDKRFIDKITRYFDDNKIAYLISADDNSSNDYPVLAGQAYEIFKKNKADGMILLCGTGIGMSMVANKFKGIRAVLATEEAQAYFARRHEDANALVFGVGYDDGLVSMRLCSRKMIRILDKFVTTDFEGERHLRRIKQINKIEKGENLDA